MPAAISISIINIIGFDSSPVLTLLVLEPSDTVLLACDVLEDVMTPSPEVVVPPAVVTLPLLIVLPPM